MLIIAPSKTLAEKCSWIVNVTLFLGTFLFFLGSFSAFFSEKEGASTTAIRRSSSVPYPYESIGYGPLALNGMREQNPVPYLPRELRVLARNSRPDTPAEEVALLMELKSAQQEIIAFNGNPIFLKQEENDTFTFSSVPTSLSVSPFVMDGGEVLIKVFLEDKKGEFILKETPKRSKTLNQTAFAKALKGGKWWGPDLFLENYGGKDYLSMFGKHKLEFENSVCFVSEGDFLTWENGTWKPVSEFSLSPFLPLARVSKVSSHGITLEAWDETGFGLFSVQLTHPQVPRVNYKMEELLSAARPRAASELSCILGKRRVVLREGDWWLKTANGWRHLKKLEDIEGYLDHRIRGELFIFETIAMERGKATVKGHCFDAMRTQMQPITLNISTEKTNSLIAKKGRGEKQESPYIAYGKAQGNSKGNMKGEEKPRRIPIPHFKSPELEEKPAE